MNKKFRLCVLFITIIIIITVSACGRNIPSGNTELPEVSSDFVISQYRTNTALEGYPLLVGGHAHGAQNIQILSDLQMGNMVWIPKYGYGMGNTPWDADNGYAQDVDAALANNLYYMISHKRGLGEAVKNGGPNSGGDTSMIFPNNETDINKILSGGKNFIGYMAEELDADLLQCALNPAFGNRIDQLLNFATPAEARILYEKEMQRLQLEAAAMGGRFLSNQIITHQLNAFRANNDIVMSELLEHLPTTQLQLSYLRGGKNQFGNDWGVWVSPWADGVPSADTSLWPNSYARVGKGHAASSFKLSMYESYVSGARIITQQETEPLFARTVNGYKDVLWGTELKNFWSYAKNYQDKMVPTMPFAVMIDRDNGWEPSNLWTGSAYEDRVWGKLQPTRGDVMLDKFYDTFLPGYKRTPESAASQTDLYPGFFASTPAGPFDVVASDISAERLSQYPTVIMLGDINMNSKLMDTLKTYVQYGGNLVINAYQSMENNRSKFYESPEFFGYEFFNRSVPDWRLTNVVNGSAVIKLNDAMPYMPTDTYSEWSYTVNGNIDGANVVAYDDNNLPVVVKNKYGSGTVYLTLSEYMLSAFANPKAMDFYVDFLKALVLQNTSMVKVFPSATEGTVDFSYVSSYQSDDLVICLSGYGNTGGKVDIIVGDSSIQDSQINVDIGINKTFTARTQGNNKIITVELFPQDITLVRISNIN